MSSECRRSSSGSAEKLGNMHMDLCVASVTFGESEQVNM